MECTENETYIFINIALDFPPQINIEYNLTSKQGMSR